MLPSIDDRCRICQETRVNALPNSKLELLSPCRCTGSVKYVHRGCLERWRVEKQGTDLYSACELCKTPYAVTKKTPSFLDYLRYKVSGREMLLYVGETIYLLLRTLIFFERIWRQYSRKHQMIQIALSRSEVDTLDHESIISSSTPSKWISLTTDFLWCVGRCFVWEPSEDYVVYPNITIVLYYVMATLKHILEFKKWKVQGGIETLRNREETDT